MDAALAELGRLERERVEIEEQKAKELARVELEAVEASRPLAARQAQLEAAVERFCREHWPALDHVNGHARRSRRLLFGRVGYRMSQAVAIRDEGRALRALASWRAGRQFLRVRTELDREALRDYLANGRGGRVARVRRRLGRAGIGLEQRENWFYELNRRVLERWGGAGKD